MMWKMDQNNAQYECGLDRKRYSLEELFREDIDSSLVPMMFLYSRDPSKQLRIIQTHMDQLCREMGLAEYRCKGL